MTFMQIASIIGVVLVLICFFGAIAGIFQDDGYHPMSPDEEYRWLTEEHGLTHEEAMEIVNGPPVH